MVAASTQKVSACPSALPVPSIFGCGGREWRVPAEGDDAGLRSDLDAASKTTASCYVHAIALRVTTRDFTNSQLFRKDVNHEHDQKLLQ